MEKAGNRYSESMLIQLLKTFTKDEMKELEKFAQSPFHNNRSDVAQFCTKLRDFHPGFAHRDFSKQSLYRLLYPKTKYRDDVMRRLSSNLLKLAEEYGSYKMYRKKEFEYNKNLLEFYLSKPAVNFLAKQLKRTEADLEESTFRDARYFLNRNFLEEYKRLSQLRIDSSGKAIDTQHQIENVWKFAAITLFRLFKIANVHSVQFNRKYNAELLETILKYVEENGFMDSKALEIWYRLIKFHMDERNDESFFRLKKMLEQNFAIFEPVENFIIHVSLLEYCFDMLTIPTKNFTREEFEIVKQMLDNGLLLQDEVFHPEWFMYAVITSLRAREIAFANEFIERYRENLPLKQKDNILNHAYAELEIEKNNYENALEYLAISKYTNVAEKLRANHMYIKIYYELGMNEQFFYNVDSFKHLIMNEQSINTETKLIRQNFIKFAVKLFKIKLGESALSAGEVKKEVMKSRIMGHFWLISKIEELERTKN